MLTNKFVFIGSGIATVFAVLELLEAGITGNQITIIDAGKDIYNRSRSEVLRGFFGGGGFSDGKIVYSIDRGGQLKEYVGIDQAIKFIDIIKEKIRKYHPNPTTIVNTPKNTSKYLEQLPFKISLSEVDHLGTDGIFEVATNIYEIFKAAKVNLYFEVECFNIDFKAKKIFTFNNSESTYIKNCIKSFEYDYLTIAVGRSGAKFINKILEDYHLDYKTRAAQVGVRFESKAKYFKELLKYQYDFKLLKEYNHSKYGTIIARTFCVNSGCAHVTIENNISDSISEFKVSFNGHSLNSVPPNGNINFGIILEISNIENPLAFTNQLVDNCNLNSKGLVYSPNKLINCIDSQIYQTTNFVDFSSRFGQLTYIIKDFIEDLNASFKFNSDFKIYAPEVKFLTNQIIVEPTLNLQNYPEVYFAGDCLSARGIFVSAAHGILVAQNILETYKNKLEN